jgi:hypothetical protein
MESSTHLALNANGVIVEAVNATPVDLVPTLVRGAVMLPTFYWAARRTLAGD